LPAVLTEAGDPAFSVVTWISRRTRRQVVIAAVVVAAYLALRSARAVAQVVLDRWWFASVTKAPIWSTKVAAQLELGAAAALVTLLLLGSSVILGTRVPAVGTTAPNGVAFRYRQRMGPAHRWLLVAVVVVMTYRIARAATAQWPQWLLFRNGASLHQKVPELGQDLGYYLFDLPFLAVVSAWIRQLLLAAILIAAFAYAVSGAIRLPIKGARSNPRALAHLGLLAAAFAAVQAMDYVFVRRAGFATDTTGSFVGAGYTDLHVGVPATYALAVIAVICGALLVDAVRRDRWRLALGALAAWGVLHLVLLGLVPALVQRFVVTPAAGAKELPYYAHNLDATREAFGLADVAETTHALADGVTDAAAVTAADLGRIPLFDTTQLPAALQVLQGTLATRISDVDLDRYLIDGKKSPVDIGARMPSQADLPASGWVQLHLVYTHGNGVVVVPADTTDADGRPDVGALADTITPGRPQLYFGEGLRGWYAIVGTKRVEQGGEAFAGDTGIPLDSLWRRGVLALASGDVAPLFSAELTSQSQLLYRRDLTERLGAIAPFLTLAADPYPVVTAHGITWIVDGYTSSSTYPYAQFTSLASSRVNYVHPSIKATVDGYDGTVHLYKTESGGDDPILAAWEKTFPHLIEPISSLPDELHRHLIYPPEMLNIQNSLLGRYHVNDVETLFNGTQRWTPAAAAIPGVGQKSPGPSSPVTQVASADQPVGGGDFAGTTPFTPGTAPGSSSARDLLAALSVADHDHPERLRLLTIDRANGQVISSPSLAQSAIDADPELAARFTLLNANGSAVSFGPMTPEIVDGGLVWVRSIIVTGTAATAIPRIYGVVAVSHGLVGFGHDPVSAINAIAKPAS
jgi:uncharacterized protein